MSPNEYEWHQCAIGSWAGDDVQTDAFPNGADALTIATADAAGLSNSAGKTVLIDNQTPSVSFSGPTDAPATAGTQYVTATAATGPSGAYGLDCSLDGGPGQWFPGSAARIAVNGIGTHQLSCDALSNAVDADGTHATSATQTDTLKIGTPTVAVVGFDRIVDRLRCHRVTERVLIPARTVTVRVDGRNVQVRERAHRQRIRLTRCHVRTALRRIKVTVIVRRHGRAVKVRRFRVVRVLLEPHLIRRAVKTVAHGHGTTVDGWIGTTGGTALGGQTVQILTAADNGRNNFHVAATVTTAANGSWSTRIGSGPSRLIKAYYPGAPSTEAAVSAPAALVVPARIAITSITPSQVAWGGTIRISGHLSGGYYPRGGVLVRLRIGEGTAVTTYGVHTHVGAHHGRFSTSYTFGVGEPSQYRTFWFEVATLPMGDYPYAPGASNRRYVVVGGNPPVPHPRRRRKHRR